MLTLCLRVLIIILCFSVNSFAAYRYVDGGTIESSATWSGTDGASYTDSGAEFPGAGYGYSGVQAAIDAAVVGDKIYIRTGTYTNSGSTNSAAFYIASTKSGTSWDEGDYFYIGSYPGEWAVLDGEGSAPGGVTLGNTNTYSGCSSLEQYWVIERLGITGGCTPGDNSTGGAGIFLRGGPLKIRYCYIYDNFDDSYEGNPGGLRTYILRDSVIEYNYFYHNGYNGTNGDQIQFFTDYNDEAGGYTDVADITCAQRNNDISYNYLDGSNGTNEAEVGIKYKASQMLTDTDATYTTYKDYGDEIHHNIILNHSSGGIMLRQDFVQAHNNIMTGGIQWN